jgi:hypothetical protein
MGHTRLGSLPRTRKWDEVVSLIADGTNVEGIAGASAAAAERSLDSASRDEGLGYTFWLLTQIPQAARHRNFAERLWELGLNVPSNPTLFEIVAAYTTAIDRHVEERGRRSDIGEMAQHAATETLTTLVGQQLPRLFEPTTDDVQRAVAALGTSDRFSIVARDFFSRLTSRSLGYFLSRVTSTFVGPSQRFGNINEHSAFNAALDLHCRETSRVIKEFSREWYGKSLSLHQGQITPRRARNFAHIAFQKLRAELRRRRNADD